MQSITSRIFFVASVAIVLAATFGVLASAAPLHAQELSVRAAAGAAVPVGGAGERRDTGPAATLSVEARLNRFWRLRLAGDWSLLQAHRLPAGQDMNNLYRDLRTLGVSLDAVGRWGKRPVDPYVMAGIGEYQLLAVGGHSPYGRTGAFQVGGGIDGEFWRRINPFIEVRIMVHLTDYGTDVGSPTVYWPILIGLRMR